MFVLGHRQLAYVSYPATSIMCANEWLCLFRCYSYYYNDGSMNDFHHAHYFSLASRGAALVMMEFTAVDPLGRVSPRDSGLWKDEQIAPMKRVVDAINSQGTVAGLQLNHGGRKAPSFCLIHVLYLNPNGPSADDNHGKPSALNKEQIKDLVPKYADAAVRADKAGVQLLELHDAHG